MDRVYLPDDDKNYDVHPCDQGFEAIADVWRHDLIASAELYYRRTQDMLELVRQNPHWNSTKESEGLFQNPKTEDFFAIRSKPSVDHPSDRFGFGSITQRVLTMTSRPHIIEVGLHWSKNPETEKYEMDTPSSMVITFPKFRMFLLQGPRCKVRIYGKNQHDIAHLPSISTILRVSCELLQGQPVDPASILVDPLKSEEVLNRAYHGRYQLGPAGLGGRRELVEFGPADLSYDTPGTVFTPVIVQNGAEIIQKGRQVLRQDLAEMSSIEVLGLLKRWKEKTAATN